MNKSTIFILLGLFVISGCNISSKYPGFSKTKNGIYYKLHNIGESTKKPNPGDYITVDIVYKTIDDSTFFKGRRKFQITEPSFKGLIDECFTMLAENESASFIISADDFFQKTLETSLPQFFKENSAMKVDLEMLEIQTTKEYQMEKEAFLCWIEDFGDYEKLILKQFIEQKKIEVKPTETGLYYITLTKGTGKQVEKGDTVLVHYEGKFLNGKFFDSTKKRNEAFQFVYGQKWQVIKGLEEAIGLMHEGEKALFILPSELAFGKTGSSSGIIPPFTTVIFEVELKNIN